MNALLGFMRKEVRHVLRDRRTLLILLLLPLAQVLLFGFAVRTDIREIRLILVDPAPDPPSHALRARLQGTALFTVTEVVPTAAGLEERFRRGEIHQALVLPPARERFGAGRPPTVQLITDTGDPNTGSTMAAYTTQVLRRWERTQGWAVQDGGAPRQQGGQGPRTVPQVRMRYNPTLESVNLFVPGLIAVVLTVVSALMSAISLSREKERGTLEVLLVSPLRSWQIIVGKVLPYLALGFANVASVLLVAAVVFQVPFRGSLPLLLGESLLFVVASLALGVLIAAVTSSQRTAMLGALMALMLPTVLLSGMIFPIASMPSWLQAVSMVVPGRWFLAAARGVMLTGAGLAELWQETLILVVMTAVALTAAGRAFGIRLEGAS